jgi:hypothetical protein
MRRWLVLMLMLMLIALLGPCPAIAQSFQQADRELRAAEKLFQGAHEWVVPEDTPRIRALMKREWHAEQVWAAAYLARYPGATHAELRHPQLGKRDIPLTFDFAHLGRGAFLVAARDGEVGTVFILAPGDGGLTPIWSVTDARTPAGLARGNELHNWSADCSVLYSKQRICLPLWGRIGILPSKADGTERFYIDATYAQDAGATVANQFTIWDWNGAKATPRYLKIYLMMVEQPTGLRHRGDTIILRMKEDWGHFHSCGQCNGRQRDLTLKLTPSGQQEFGVRSIHPELDRIDLLIDRVLAGKPAGDVASDQAIAMVRSQLSENLAQMKDPKQADIAPLLGMVMNYRITHRKRETQVCLDLDSDISNRFTLLGNRITSVTPIKAGACAGPGSDA